MVSHTQPMAFTAAADCDLSREDSLRRWLALHTEPPLEPELPFVDCHHHLMDHREPKGELRPIEEARPEAFRLFLGPTTPMYGCRYLLDEYAEDIATSGHNVTHTVYLEASSFYLPDGPPALRPVGEVRFAQGVAAMSASGRYGPTKVCAAIVGFADMGLPWAGCGRRIRAPCGTRMAVLHFSFFTKCKWRGGENSHIDTRLRECE